MQTTKTAGIDFTGKLNKETEQVQSELDAALEHFKVAMGRYVKLSRVYSPCAPVVNESHCQVDVIEWMSEQMSQIVIESWQNEVKPTWRANQ